MKERKFVFILLVLTSFFCNLIAQQTEVRGAIDFGSGAIKIQVGLVDIEENQIIGNPLLAKNISLSLTEDVAAHDGFISDEMVQHILSILSQLKIETINAAKQLGQSKLQFAGIATAMFRKAHNGAETLQKIEQQLGISFQILSQEDEGRLGFMNAKALYPEIPEAQIVAWDNGNGSFQMTAKENNQFKVYYCPLGYGTVRTILATDIRMGTPFLATESGNPVLKEEGKKLAQHIITLLPAIPDWMTTRITAKKAIFVTFGEGKSLFAVMADAQALSEGKKLPVSEMMITLTDFRKMVDVYLEKGDEFFDSIGVYNRTSSASVYLVTVMEQLGIDAIHYRKSIGNTSGMLIHPQLWKGPINHL